MKTIVIHRVTSSKFGNRMKYTKEKTGPYHTGFSHFLCHCITDFFLSVDIQIVSLVIYARFLYHCPITEAQEAVSSALPKVTSSSLILPIFSWIPLAVRLLS